MSKKAKGVILPASLLASTRMSIGNVRILSRSDMCEQLTRTARKVKETKETLKTKRKFEEIRMQVYLDYAAATPMDPRVIAAQMPYLSEQFYNPSAPYDPARRIRRDLDLAKDAIAHAIGAKGTQLVMCAGATEANNLALASVTGEVITDSLEHDSILAAIGARPHKFIPTTSDGMVTPEELQAAITDETELVSIEAANGEIGSIQPIRALANVVRSVRFSRLERGVSRPIYFHTDASQAEGVLSVNVSSLGVDMMTLSAAKIYGPKQVGALYASDAVTLTPLVRGGGQEAGLRSGTENCAGTIAFAKAVECAEEFKRSGGPRAMQELRDYLERSLLSRYPWARVTGPRKNKLRLCNLLHISFPKLEARRLVILLERRGVFVATGSACAASKMNTSHVLKALAIPDDIAQGSLRITLGRTTTRAQIDYAISCIKDVVDEELARLHLDEAELLASMQARA